MLNAEGQTLITGRDAIYRVSTRIISTDVMYLVSTRITNHYLLLWM